jgi:hypothetical protein
MGIQTFFLYVSMLWRLVPSSQNLRDRFSGWEQAITIEDWHLEDFWTSSEQVTSEHDTSQLLHVFMLSKWELFGVQRDTKTRVAESPGVTCSPRCCCSCCCGGRIVGMPDGGRRTASADIQVLEKSRKGQTCLKCLEGTSMRSVFQCGNTMKIYEIRTYLKSSMRGARRFMRHVWLQALATSC